MNNTLENIKIAVVLRSARSAIGWNQQEFADRMEVAKSTIARIETLEMAAKADFLTRALRLYREAGVTVDLLGASQVNLTVELKGLEGAAGRLQDDSMRRSDRVAKNSKNQRKATSGDVPKTKPESAVDSW